MSGFFARLFSIYRRDGRLKHSARKWRIYALIYVLPGVYGAWMLQYDPAGFSDFALGACLAAGVHCFITSAYADELEKRR